MQDSFQSRGRAATRTRRQWKLLRALAQDAQKHTWKGRDREKDGEKCNHRSYNGTDVKGGGGFRGGAPMKHKQETEIRHRGKEHTDA